MIWLKLSKELMQDITQEISLHLRVYFEKTRENLYAQQQLVNKVPIKE